MKLEEFKEKLFRKANAMSVSMDYSGSTYQVVYIGPDKETRISVTANFHPNNKLSSIRLGMTTLDDYCYSVLYIPYLDDSKEVEKFLNKVEESGYLDSKD